MFAVYFHFLKYRSVLLVTASLLHTFKNAFEVKTTPWNSAVHFIEAFKFDLSSYFHFDIIYQAHSFIFLNDLKVWQLALSKASFHFLADHSCIQSVNNIIYSVCLWKLGRLVNTRGLFIRFETELSSQIAPDLNMSHSLSVFRDLSPKFIFASCIIL